MKVVLINLAYLIASILFIYGLKGLAHPRTAVRANQMGALGMLLAIVATLFDKNILSFEIILLGLVIGSAIGAFLALKVKMTQMPQMVALLNGFGGAASALVGGSALIEALKMNTLGTGIAQTQFTVSTAASGLIGAVTFWGSLVAYAKLQELVKDKDIPRFAGQQIFNAVLFGIVLLLSAWLIAVPSATLAYWLIVLVSSVLGVSLVINIGGADMPVVIALLNSYSGLAACATGFVLNNYSLVITGSLVGASGIILSDIMCKAMNRSLTNVLFGVWVPAESGPSGEQVYAGRIKSSSAEEIAMLLDGASRVIIVPGYGMAVAQAQHAVRDLVQLLETKGATVEFAIHPVAGRMPGHMNVLLAEANIPYEKVKEMDEINPSFAQTDVAIVIGANDVVNPVAQTDPKSPIAGMPILDVISAKSVVVVKRSLSPGFAGIPNPLFAADNTVMFFADAKKGLLELVSALKEA